MAHGWHVGRGICLVQIWHMFLAYLMVYCMVLLYMVDAHGYCAWLAHSMTHDVHG
jgi:hypothetical protein